jgi:hypothetical protein
MTNITHAGIEKIILGTEVARYYPAQTTADQAVFAVNPQNGGPGHYEVRRRSDPKGANLPPPRRLQVIGWAHGVVHG